MTIYGQDCFIGMKIKVDDQNNGSWESRFGFSFKMTEALVK